MYFNKYEKKFFIISFIITLIISLFIAFAIIAISNSQLLIYGDKHLQSFSNHNESLVLNNKKSKTEKILTDLYDMVPTNLKLKFQIFKVIDELTK